MYWVVKLAGFVLGEISKLLDSPRESYVKSIKEIKKFPDGVPAVT